MLRGIGIIKKKTCHEKVSILTIYTQIYTLIVLILWREGAYLGLIRPSITTSTAHFHPKYGSFI